ncbi:MAG: PLP-dependent transferase [Candidatus Margulisiibacteriota bacterium]
MPYKILAVSTPGGTYEACLSLVNEAFKVGMLSDRREAFGALQQQPLQEGTKRQHPHRESSWIGTTKRDWPDGMQARFCKPDGSVSAEYPTLANAAEAFASLGKVPDDNSEFPAGALYLYNRLGTPDTARLAEQMNLAYGLGRAGGFVVSSGQAALTLAELFAKTHGVQTIEVLDYEKIEDRPKIEAALRQLQTQTEPVSHELILANYPPRLFREIPESSKANIRPVLSTVAEHQPGYQPGNTWGWIGIRKGEYTPMLCCLKDFGKNMSGVVAKGVDTVDLTYIGEQLDLEKMPQIQVDLRKALALHIARTESADAAFVTTSGMAAIDVAIRSALPQGGKLLYLTPVYGCTVKLFDEKYPTLGIQTVSHRFSATDAFIAAIQREKPKVVFFEPVANPTCEMVDIIAILRAAKDAGVERVIIDNTFLTDHSLNMNALLQKAFGESPSAYRAYRQMVQVVYSATKHKDMGVTGDTWGCLTVNDRGHALAIEKKIKAEGVEMAISTAELVFEESLSKYDTHVEIQHQNANRFAEFLVALNQFEIRGHRLFSQINFPGVGTARTLAEAQLKQGHFGTVLFFELNPELFTDEQVVDFVNTLAQQSFIRLAVSLGKPYTLFEISSKQVHSGMSPDERRRDGIAEFGIRLSLGCEDADDIIREFSLALVKTLDETFVSQLRQWVAATPPLVAV